MKRTLALAAAVAALSSPLLAQGTAPQKPEAPPSPAAPAAPAAPVIPDEQTLYALGVSVAKGLAGFSFSPAEAESVMKGIADGLGEKAGALDTEAFNAKIRALAQSRASARLEKEKAKGQAFREQAAKAAGAVALPSGLVYADVTPGTGESPGPKDTVKVKYRGTLIDGTEFDNSAKRAEPASFGLDRVIPCWTEGVQKMKTGGKAHLVCPPEIAYGDRGRPGIPAGATLVFDLELVETAKPAPAPAPAPKLAAPAPSPSPKQ